MPITAATAPHIIIGFLVLCLYWVTLLSPKGGPRHRRTGKWFLLALTPVVVSVVPIVLFQAGQLQPAALVQVTYLSICIGTVGHSAWSAIVHKHNVSGFVTHGFVVRGF